MKKWTALLLALVVCLSLCACGGGSQSAAGSADLNDDETAKDTESTLANVWEVPTLLDEFGDETNMSSPVIAQAINGDFSNTATTSSELSGVVNILLSRNQFIPVFSLMEYDDVKATYTTSDLNNGIVLKTKVNDSVQQYSLTGTVPNGALILSDQIKPYTFFYELLKYQEDMKCVIEIGSSKYNFTIKYGNLAQKCEEVFGIPSDAFNSSPDTMTTAEALFILLTDNGEHFTDARDYLEINLESFTPMSDDEILNGFNGKFLKIVTKYSTQSNGLEYPYWRVYDFSPDGSGRIMDMDFVAEFNGYRPFRIEEKGKLDDLLGISANDGQLDIYNLATGDGHLIERCYKMSDNIYITKHTGVAGVLNVYIRLSDDFQNEDDFYNCLMNVIRNDLSQLTK